MGLWREYCAAQTPEAKYVKDLDKLELILQADEYEETQNVDLQQFFDNTRNVFQTETGCPHSRCPIHWLHGEMCPAGRRLRRTSAGSENDGWRETVAQTINSSCTCSIEKDGRWRWMSSVDSNV